MHCDIPDFKRCCCFVPLRYGILTLGYLNMIFTICLITFEVWVDWGYNPLLTVSVANYRGVSMFVQMWFPHLLYALEVIFDVILLVGAHTKRYLLIRMYYYYGILTTVATFLTFVVVRYRHGTQDWYWITFEYCFAFSGFVLQVYLLLLIRTELQKLKQQRTGHSYENNITEVVLYPPMSGGGRNYVSL